MKKINLWLLVLSIILFGCKKSDTPNPQPNPQTVKPAMVKHDHNPRAVNTNKLLSTPRLQSTTLNTFPLRGANAAGGEMDYGSNNVNNPVSGTDYLFITHQDIDYLASKGMNFVRLIFSWEGVQPTLNSPLASTGNNGLYVSTLVDRVNYITNTKGMYCLVEPHGASSNNFARYKGNLVGSAQVPNSAFADFWARMATLFAGNNKVMFGLSNEPHDMSTVQWFSAAQAAITGIRNTGNSNTIFIPGNCWTGAESWTDASCDTGNPKVSSATAFGTLKDPLNNLVVSVHTYADANAGGGATDIVNNTILSTRFSDTVNWAKQTGVRVHLSEFAAAASNSLAQSTINNLVTYMNSNTDVVMGGSWWATGNPQWWSGYVFTLVPTNNYTVDSPQMKLLINSGFMNFTAPPAPTPTPTPTPAPTPTVADAGSPQDAGVDSGTTTPTFYAHAVTYTKWNTGYCTQVYIRNNTSNTQVWHKLIINMQDSTLRDFGNGTTTATWGTGGNITFAPVSYDASVAPNAKVATVWLCSDYGPTQKEAVATYIK